MASHIEPDLLLAGTEATGGGSLAAGSSARKKPNADPLVYLRDFITAKKKVQMHDDWLDFEGHKIHRNAKCGFTIQKGGTLIDVGSVWYMFHMTSADRAYTKALASDIGFAYIGIDRRGDLCDFLLGRISTCVGLVKEVIEGRKRPRERAPRMPPNKAEDSSLGDLLTYEDVTKRVRSVQDLDVVIRRPGRLVPNADMILKIAQEEWQSFTTGIKKAAPVSSKRGAEFGQVPLHIELEENLRKNENNVPIVLVPCNKLAPINLLNVQSLLQDGIYLKQTKDRLMFFESTRPETVEVKRNIGGKLWTFEVRDSVKNFTKQQWLRTVLVITDGNEWQFKNWPFESVVDLFCTMRGVYFQDPGKPLPVHVLGWPCMKLQIPTDTNAHRWANLRDEIFKDIEEFMNTARIKKFVNSSKLDGGRRIVENCKNIL